MPFRGEIRWRGHPSAAPKLMRAAVKKQMVGVIDTWHEDMLPEHFKIGASTKYRYKDRSPKYLAAKRKYAKGQQDLVWSGELKRQVESRIDISTTSKGGRGTMKGPAYLHRHRKRYNQPHKADELIRTTVQELTELAHQLDAEVTRDLNNDKTEVVRKF